MVIGLLLFELDNNILSMKIKFDVDKYCSTLQSQIYFYLGQLFIIIVIL